MAGIADPHDGNNPEGKSAGQDDPVPCPFCGVDVGRLPYHIPKCPEAP